MGEAKHVYVNFVENKARILEVGFGSGLNALLCVETKLQIEYTTVELYPIPIETARELSFYSSTLELLHSAKWEEWVAINPKFKLRKLKLDIEKQIEKLPDEKFNLVFFDPFAPEIVPKQWNEKIFEQIFQRLCNEGKLLTYSAKGVVKQTLRKVGFTVKRLPGALGKHNMLIAIKTKN